MKKRAARYGLAFMAPSFAGVAAFFALPFVYSVFLSFTRKWRGRTVPTLEVYRDVVSSDAFRLAMTNTLRFWLLGLPALLVLSLALALTLQRLGKEHRRLYAFLFAASLLPLVLPSAVVALFVRILFASKGLINGAIAGSGGQTVDFFRSGWTFPLLLFLFVWRNYGYGLTVLLGGLYSVAPETLEAARIDGASPRQILLYIQLPQITPFVLFSCILDLMGLFRLYRESYLLFGKYPYDSVYMLQNYMNNNFEALNFPRLSGTAMLLLLVLSLIIAAILRRERRTAV